MTTTPQTEYRLPSPPVLPDDSDDALIAYLRKLEQDERIREFSEEI